jgi:DNA polymerase-3 subunit beta
MKFLVSSSLLLKHIQVLSGVISNNNNLPILEHFLFEIDNSKLTITASDLETTLSATIDVESDSNDKIAIPAKMLLDTLKTFAEQPLTFIQNKEEKLIEISSDTGKYKLAFADGNEFPKANEIEEPYTINVKSEIIQTAISKTIFATGNDDLRPVMSGVFFSFRPEGLVFVATDAHKLVKYQRSDAKTDGVEADFIMPKKPLNLLKNTLSSGDEEIKIEYNLSNAKFTIDNMVMSCVLIEGKYPNYEAVIPKANPNVLTINRHAFLSSVKRVSIFSNRTTHQIKLNIVGSQLQISAEDLDYSNKADERITCNYQGEDMAIGFNSRFLTEMLNNLDSDEVILEMSAPNRAGILTPSDGLQEGEKILMLVMPVMINS